MKFVPFAKELIHSVTKHNLGMLAAAVAFFAFSAMLPLLVIVVFGALYFIPPSAVRALLSTLLDVMAPTVPHEVNLVSESVARLFDLRGRMSLVALFGLLWTVIGGFVSFQQILDIIWELRTHRSFVKQYVIGFIMVGFFLLLAVASSVAAAIPRVIAADLQSLAHGAGWPHVVVLLSQVILPMSLFVAVYFSYRFLPSHALRDPPLVAGAVLATAAIMLSRAAFNWYLGNLGQYELLYGALAFVVLLLFWIYIVSVVILLCGEIIVCWSRLHEHSGAARSAKGRKRTLPGAHDRA